MPESSNTRWSRNDAPRGDAYDVRWRDMEERGENPHGEVDFVMTYQPRSVLDAGCGTGRVAIELARRGVSVVGVDLDAEMLAAAREKSPELDWRRGDLSRLDLGETFDLVLAAGNVMIFLAAGTERAAVECLAAHLDVGGHLVVGFQVRADRYPLDDYDAHAAVANLEMVARFGGWHGEAYRGGAYAVSVHRRV